MSVDDSIAVLKSQGTDGRPEYRVAHVYSMPLTWAEMALLSDEDLEMTAICLQNQFAGSILHRNHSDALRRAQHLVEECRRNSPWGELANGICEVDIGIRFPQGYAQAVAIAEPPRVSRRDQIAGLESRLGLLKSQSMKGT
jgi:hypothetical protein